MSHALFQSRTVRLAAAAGMLGLSAACAQGTGQVARQAVAGAHPGGTLVVGITEPGSVDPSNAYEPAGNMVMSTTCESLIQFDPITAKPGPGIAKEWIVTGDGESITVTMRTGVHYHSGGRVKADDIIAELSRAATLETASNSASLLSPIFGYSIIHGDEQSDNAEALKKLLGLDTVSDNSFHVSLYSQQANASLVDLFGDTIAAPTPRSAILRPDFSSKPSCAGPYEMTTPWKAGDKQLVVQRFARYYAHNPVFPNGGRGYADRIDFRIYPTREAELPAYKSGLLDVAQVTDAELPAAQKLATDTQSQLVSAANGNVEYVGFPTGNSVFAKALVRRALSAVLDRQALSTAAYGGGALPATGFLPPTVGENYKPNACDAAPATGDVVGARALLASSGVKLQGQALPLFFANVNRNAALAKAVADQWTRAFGIRVTLMPLAPHDFLARGASADGFAGAFLEGWGAPYPSADNYLAPLLSSPSIGQNNFAHFADAAFDRLLTRGARRAADASTRRVAYDYLAKIACVDLPLAPLVDLQSHYLVRTTVVGSAIGSFTDASTGFPDLREIYVK